MSTLACVGLIQASACEACFVGGVPGSWPLAEVQVRAGILSRIPSNSLYCGQVVGVLLEAWGVSF